MNKADRQLRSQDVVGLAALLFGGAAFLSWTLSAWSLTAALNITRSFAVRSGFFSNWMIWAAMGFGIRALGKRVERELTEREAPAPVLIPAQRTPTVPPDDTSAATA